MKKSFDVLPALLVLFFTYLIYSKSHHLAPAVGLIMSCFLFAYQQYLFKIEQPNILKELEDLRKEYDLKIDSIRSLSDKELTTLKDDIAKFSISMTRIPGVVEKSKDRPQVKF